MSGLLNQSSGLADDDDRGPRRGGRPMPGRGGNRERSRDRRRRSRSGARESGPPESELTGRFKSMIDEIPADGAARNTELRGWASGIVDKLDTPELNQFCLFIKEALQEKKMKKKKDRAAQRGNGASAPAHSPAQEQNAMGNGAAPLDKGNKPGMTNDFHPLMHLDSGNDAANNDAAKADDEKPAVLGWQPKRYPKRTQEEEERFTELLHSIAEQPMIKEDENNGEPNLARFDEIIDIAKEVCKQPRHWFSVWSNCAIRNVEHSKTCATHILGRLSNFDDMDEVNMAEIIGHLMTQKEIGIKTMDAALANCHDFNPAKSKEKFTGLVLVWIYPTTKEKFGWSRIGWGFKEWSQQMKKYLRHMDNPLACMETCVSTVIEYSGEGVGFIATDNQEKLLTRAMEFTATREEAVERLGLAGDPTVKPSPSPSEPAGSDES